MKIPRGTKLSTLRNKKPSEVTKDLGVLSGYIRFSASSENLKDYFLFVKGGKTIGAYGEVEKEEELLGDGAYERIFTTESFDIVETFELSGKVIDILFENYPEVQLGKKKKIERRAEEEEGLAFCRIGNIKVPLLSPHKLFLKISSTDFNALLGDLKKERISGFARVFSENMGVVEEGCLFFSGGECVGAVYECGPKIRYGEEAVFLIQSSFYSPKGLVDVYAGDISKIIEKNEGLRISKSAEKIIEARKEEEKNLHQSIFSHLGLSPRTPAMNYPSDDIFSYQTLIKILAEKRFSGLLKIKDKNQGVVFFSEGRPSGALLFGKERVVSNKAYESILDLCEGECEIEVYPLPENEISLILSGKEMSFLGEEMKENLEKYVMRELGEGSDIDVRRATAFKQQWERRREKL